MNAKDVISHIDLPELTRAARELLAGGQTPTQVADDITDALVAILPLELAEVALEGATVDPTVKALEVAGSVVVNAIERPVVRLVVGLIVGAANRKMKREAASLPELAPGDLKPAA